MLGSATAVVFGLASVIGAAEKPEYDVRIHVKGGPERADVVYEFVANGKWYRIAKRPQRATAKGTLPADELKKIDGAVRGTEWSKLPEEIDDGEEGVARLRIRVTQGEKMRTIIRNADDAMQDPVLKVFLQAMSKMDAKAKSS